MIGTSRLFLGVCVFVGAAACAADSAKTEADASGLQRDANAAQGGTGGGGGYSIEAPDATGPGGNTAGGSGTPGGTGTPGGAGGEPGTGGSGGEAGAGGSGGDFVKPDGAVTVPTDGATTPDARLADAGPIGPDGCAPTPELCDGADNDCDGEIDEMFLGTGEACDTGRPGLCARGVNRCETGVLTCRGLEPLQEVCDNQDNDCDGDVDEEDGQGGACDCQGGVPQLALMQVCAGGEAGASHVEACADGTELHIFTAYESAGRNGFVNIDLSRTGAPLAIVLSAYEPTTWVLSVGEGVQLESILLNGYNQQLVQNAPEGANIVDLSGVGNYLAACAYVWPSDDQGCDTPALVEGAEAALGLHLTTFQGCYGATSFGLSNL